MNTALTTVACFVIVYKLCYYLLNRKNILKNCQTVPEVHGRLPLIGNGIQFMMNSTKFIRNAYKTYGKIFKINLFGNEFVLICDRELTKCYFKQREDALSLYSLFESIFMVDAFVANKDEMIEMTRLLKNSISLKPEFVDIMASEAKSLIKTLSSTKGEPIQLAPFLRNYIARTSFRCFIAPKIDDNFFRLLHQFAKLVNMSLMLSYVVPKWILRWFWRPILRYYRRKMHPLLIEMIQNCRKNENENEGQILRKALDYVDERNGKSFSDEQTADLIILFMWISTENTTQGLSNAFIDLLINSKYWSAIKDEMKDYIKTEDYKRVLNSSLLTACVMESARLNTHTMATCRVPENVNLVIGEEKYLIGNANVVAISPPLMQVYEGSEGVFQNSDVYNPGRYTENNKESFSSKNILTWGSGIHLCPGKEFAINEIKIGLSFLVRYLEVRDYWGHENVINFSSAAFVERDIFIKVASGSNPLNNLEQ